MSSPWIQATRPKTLFAALAPVTMGLAFALGDGVVHLPAFVCALLGAVLIQIGTNFCNDYFDHRQGADTDHRQGPQRGLQLGTITPRQMATATVLCFALAAAASLYLIVRAGWPLLLLAVLAILSGVFYTAGRFSLAYTGMADFFVLLFFGPVAVGGTYYVQALTLPWYVVLAGFGPGLLSTPLLTVNNLRDMDEDSGNQKRTLAVRFGQTFARWEYTLCVQLALILPAFAAWGAERSPWMFGLLLLEVPACKRIASVWKGSTGAELNPVLALTGKLLMIYSLLFFVLWNLPQG